VPDRLALKDYLQRGAGLIEVSVALLVLSIGAVGLGSLQISAKRMGFEAVQRSEAAALAMDLFERLRANRVALAGYGVVNVGDASGIHLPEPPANCGESVCSPVQLGAWDLWCWEQAVVGATSGSSEGGLVRPAACVTVSGRRVTVEIAWQGYRALAIQDQGISCGDGLYGPGDANRQWLQMTSWIGEE
jgi:type IV pilus assembly protein PilV